MESDTKKLTDTTKLLRECDAGTKMAISSINEILEKVEDTKLNEILTKSRNAHEELESEIHSLLVNKKKYYIIYTSFKNNDIFFNKKCILHERTIL